MSDNPQRPKKPLPPVPGAPRAARPQAQVPRPVKPTAKPIAKPVARPIAPTGAPVAPKTAAPAAQKPTAPQPKPIRPAVSRRPVTTSSGGGGGGIVTVLLLVAAIGGGAWYFTRPKEKPAIPVVSTTPVVEAPKPVEVVAVEPEKIPELPKPEPSPMPVATAPLNVPVPPPAAVESNPYADILNLDAVAARSSAQQERMAKLLRLTLEKNQWAPYLDLLQRSMAKELSRSPDFSSVQRFDRFTANPFFMRAMLQHSLGLLAGDDTRRDIQDNERVRQHVTWLMESPEALQSFLQALTPKDKLSHVLDTWSLLSADDPEALGTYRELAIAASLVLERPKKFDWNGHEQTMSAEERYRWYKSKDKAGKLATRLTSLTAWELSWVVGVPVPESEMEWAITELGRKLKQKEWGRAYGMVPYDMQKAVTGKMKRPYDYYTFAEILEKGGICGDQSYFCVNTARSVGIPAVGISGDGPRGPHAWSAWLADDGRWAFSGRFGGYPAGTVRDPRNGDKISEQRFTRLSDDHAPSNAIVTKAQQLVWIHDLQTRLGETADAALALDAAMKISPHEADLWEKKLEVWGRMKPAPAQTQWKSFLDAMEREFRDDTEMLTSVRQAKDRYVLANADASFVKNELRGDVRDLSKLKGLTSLEEIRSAHERYASTLQKANDYPGVRHVYREALDDYGREAAKFKALAKDYWKMVQAAPTPVKQAACRDIEGCYERHIESKSGDYFDVKSQVSALEVVADCWKECGDSARAERFEKEIAKRGKKATKDAL